jgi:hypothetical protein
MPIAGKVKETLFFVFGTFETRGSGRYCGQRNSITVNDVFCLTIQNTQWALDIQLHLFTLTLNPRFALYQCLSVKKCLPTMQIPFSGQYSTLYYFNCI